MWRDGDRVCLDVRLLDVELDDLLRPEFRQAGDKVGDDPQDVLVTLNFHIAHLLKPEVATSFIIFYVIFFIIPRIKLF